MLTRRMALRVLLADESTTIKKVFQLALQDYGVEVIPVTVGLDVAAVASRVQPDIIFADVLLQKKSGYEVAQEIKANSNLAHIPVILIWSGFMEMDKQKFNSSGANGHLEKPFDTKKLRTVIQEHVLKTKNQPFADYLTFPKLPAFDEPAQIPRKVPPQLPPIPIETNASSSAWTMDSFTPLESMPRIRIADPSPEKEDDSSEDFMHIDLPAEPPRPGPNKSAVQLQIENDISVKGDDPDADSAGWLNQPLAKYNLSPDKQKEEPPQIKFNNPEPKVPNKSVKSATELVLDDEDILELDLSTPDDTVHRAMRNEPPPAVKSDAPLRASDVPLNEAELEAVIRAQSKEVIEKVVWQIVPELATQIIEREIQRLLKDRNGQN